MQTHRSDSYQVGGANMCLVILFGRFLPPSQGCKAAAGPHERRRGAVPMQEEGSGRAEIRRASPQLFLSSLSLEGRKHRDLGF